MRRDRPRSPGCRRTAEGSPGCRARRGRCHPPRPSRSDLPRCRSSYRDTPPSRRSSTATRCRPLPHASRTPGDCGSAVPSDAPCRNPFQIRGRVMRGLPARGKPVKAESDRGGLARRWSASASVRARWLGGANDHEGNSLTMLYPRGFWKWAASPGVLWLILLFVVPFYAIVSMAGGSHRPRERSRGAAVEPRILGPSLVPLRPRTARITRRRVPRRVPAYASLRVHGRRALSVDRLSGGLLRVPPARPPARDWCSRCSCCRSGSAT